MVLEELLEEHLPRRPLLFWPCVFPGMEVGEGFTKGK